MSSVSLVNLMGLYEFTIINMMLTVATIVGPKPGGNSSGVFILDVVGWNRVLSACLDFS